MTVGGSQGSCEPGLNAKVHAIEAQYADVFNAARALPVLHCIGNHEAILYQNPSATQSRFGIAQPLGTGSAIMAYHGHDNRTLEAIQAQDLGASIALNIFDLIALVPLLGSLVGYLRLIADDSFEEPWTHGNTGGDNPWPKAAGGADAGVPGWTAPWVARDASALVRVACGVEYATQSPVELVLVGHSHRPGISSGEIAGARQIALVDVGSWTYGRAEIAIVTPDGVGLAAMPVA